MHYCKSLKILSIYLCFKYLIASLIPRPLSAFFHLQEKKERAWYLKSCDKCWQNGIALALAQSVNFKPAWYLWSIKGSSAMTLRIVLPSLIVNVTFYFTRTEPGRSKIVLAHTQFSRSATLPTLASSPGPLFLGTKLFLP